MRFGIKTLEDFDVKGKTVLLRVDMNQPVDKKTGRLKSTARIEACVPTVRELSEKGAKTVLLAHQGSDIEYQNFYTTKPHAEALARLLGQNVGFIDDVCGPAAREAIRNLRGGEILMLDNVRFLSEEQTLFEMKLRLSGGEQAQTLLVRKLAPMADLYVCDAFAAAHRDQPSLCALERVLPSAMGRLFEKEYCVISELMVKPGRPCTFILGGAKVTDAFLMMEKVLENGVADQVLTGGLVGNILLAAKGCHIGTKSMEFLVKSGYEPCIDKARRLLARCGDKIRLPVDAAYMEGGKRMEAGVHALDEEVFLRDIGSETAAIYEQCILESKTVFVNGPMGVFEEELMEYGTKTVWAALGRTEGYTVLGGGDSITATAKYGLTDQMSYICTGGGALIRFLTGEELPVVKALREAGKKGGCGYGS